MPKKRLTDLRRKELREQEKQTAALTEIIQGELNWLSRRVQERIRRLNSQKPGAGSPSRRLQKADFTGVDFWELFKIRLQAKILSALESGVITLAQLQQLEPDKPFNLDTAEIAKGMEAEVGERVTNITNDLKRKVGQNVMAWYNTPGMTVRDLNNRLAVNFSPSRAKLIAQTEITILDSAVQDAVAEKMGYTNWWWMTMRDQLVCTRKMIGPDGQKYNGCRELHGKIFTRGQWRPPKGSHPGCRCHSINIARSAT